jgi:DNA-binding transcriptional regulator LsrR (DeoR family)
MSGLDGSRISTVRAAMICRRFYLEGASKLAIAEELGISRFKVARILEAALESGLVKITIESPLGVDLALSEQLRQRYGLRQAIVVDVPSETEAELRSHLGRTAAQFIQDIVTESDVLGIGWGRTLDAMTSQLDALPPCPVVQMAGVVGPLTDNALELVRRVGLLSGGPTYPLYTPLLLSDPQTASAVRTQPQVASVLRRFADITIAVVAIGSWQPPNSQLRASLPASEQRRLLKLGVRAEICSTLINDSGNPIAPEFAQKTISITDKQLKAVPESVGVAGGADKAAAIMAVLRGGLLTSLVTDRAAAAELLKPAG